MTTLIQEPTRQTATDPDEPSDASSLEFLREVAQMLREVIAQAPPTAQRRRWE